MPQKKYILNRRIFIGFVRDEDTPFLFAQNGGESRSGAGLTHLYFRPVLRPARIE